MPPTTAPPQTETAEAPTGQLEKELADAAADLHRRREDFLATLDALPPLLRQLRDAEGRLEQLRVRADLLDVTEDAEIERPDVDGPSERDVEEAVGRIGQRLAQTLREDTDASRRGRSARANFDNLREAVRTGDPESAERALRALADRLDSDLPLTDTARAAFVIPARKTGRQKAERELVRRALAWSRATFTGATPGRLRDGDDRPVRFPPAVTVLLEEFADDPRAFRSPLSRDRDEPETAEERRRRDLEAELRETVRTLPAEALAG